MQHAHACIIGNIVTLQTEFKLSQSQCQDGGAFSGEGRGGRGGGRGTHNNLHDEGNGLDRLSEAHFVSEDAVLARIPVEEEPV